MQTTKVREIILRARSLIGSRDMQSQSDLIELEAYIHQLKATMAQCQSAHDRELYNAKSSLQQANAEIARLQDRVSELAHPAQPPAVDQDQAAAVAEALTEPSDVRSLIIQECERLKTMLLEKNSNYGNSALDPIRCFSKAGPVEGINVRLDDKLSRLMRGAAAGEDVEDDFGGYLILKKVAKRLGLA